MSWLDLLLVSLPPSLMALALLRARPIMTPVPSRLVLVIFGVTLLNLARAVVVGRPILSILCFAFSSLAAGWSYRKAVQGELMAEEWERRQAERELDQ